MKFRLARAFQIPSLAPTLFVVILKEYCFTFLVCNRMQKTPGLKPREWMFFLSLSTFHGCQKALIKSAWRRQNRRLIKSPPRWNMWKSCKRRSGGYYGFHRPYRVSKYKSRRFFSNVNFKWLTLGQHVRKVLFNSGAPTCAKRAWDRAPYP